MPVCPADHPACCTVRGLFFVFFFSVPSPPPSWLLMSQEHPICLGSFKLMGGCFYGSVSKERVMAMHSFPMGLCVFEREKSVFLCFSLGKCLLYLIDTSPPAQLPRRLFQDNRGALSAGNQARGSIRIPADHHPEKILVSSCRALSFHGRSFSNSGKSLTKQHGCLEMSVRTIKGKNSFPAQLLFE